MFTQLSHASEGDFARVDANMDYPENIKAFLDWCSKHPIGTPLNHPEGSDDTYVVIEQLQFAARDFGLKVIIERNTEDQNSRFLVFDPKVPEKAWEITQGKDAAQPISKDQKNQFNAAFEKLNALTKDKIIDPKDRTTIAAIRKEFKDQGVMITLVDAFDYLGKPECYLGVSMGGHAKYIYSHAKLEITR